MNVPYNNGKVSIGKYYQKKMHFDIDGDMLLLQTSLIGDTKAIRKEKMYKTLYIILLVFGTLGLFIFN